VKQLVVTADDFGAAGAVNEAVERAHVEGVLSAASLMVAADAADDAVARARRLATLRVGLHLVLVEGRPVSDPADIPDLVTGEGLFRTDLARFGADIFFRSAVRRQATTEIEAQFQAFARTGLPLDHVNTHKHFHLHPTIQDLILEIGPRYGMTAMRAPQEPRRVLREVEPASAPPPAYVTGPWARLSRDRLRRAGIATPDQVFGLAWSGAMTPARLGGIIARLPPGLSEIYLHPAVRAYPGSGPGYRHEDELRALVDPAVVAAVRSHDLALGGYADFAARGERRQSA
jgi:hopanoid biosynthesis associated protein HpnK